MVVVPPGKGTQGVFFTRPVQGGELVTTTFWFRGIAGRNYTALVTGADGARRTRSAPWRATGRWQRRQLVARATLADTLVHVAVHRLPRAGPEGFLLDDVRIETRPAGG